MSAVNPVVLITGASRGLGRGIAVETAKLGYSVAINYASNAKAADETVALCKSHANNPQQRFAAIQANVGIQQERIRLIEQTLKEFRRVDALVNNAGMGPRVRVDITETTEESFDEVLNINLRGAFFLTQSVARYWIQNKILPAIPSGFKVIFISSISADTVSLNRPEYCISKAGLTMVSQLWAARLAELGVQVLELRPGIMATDMTRGVKEKYDKLLAEGIIPQHRWGTPEDVGLAVGAILSGKFPFTTGEVIHIDGGFHLRRL